MPLTEDDVRQALRNVKDPELHRDIVSLGMVKTVEIDGTRVALEIELTSPESSLKDRLRQEVAAALANTDATEFALEVSYRGGAGSAGRSSGGAGGGAAEGAAGTERPLPQVRSIVAVGAGKGGVGKSTVAVNLAVGLSRLGHRVGLMDGDIYGPSTPTLLGIKGQTPTVKAGKIVPFFVHGIDVITIGALVEQEKPLIWRGPMAHGAFKQLLMDNTVWPELDYLVVDLPPGTGDVSLTLCQSVPLTGAVVVATPQQVALDDAVRAVRMFQQLNTPVLGVVENMSYLVGPDGKRIDIFGAGGAENEAKRLGLPFLGALPLYPQLRVNSDRGTPHANFDGPDRDLAASLELLTANLVAQVELRRAFSPSPQLTIR
ncbi:MAG: Mrp/NBP35 family ATP-binding protein [Tepidisphaerales bacterium]